MSTEPLKLNDVTSVKLPRSCAYIYNNLIEYCDGINNICYYAVIAGYEVWIIKHCEIEKLTNHSSKEPTVQLRKVPYDKLDHISCVKWCKFNSTVTFIMATQSGIIHVYDFEAKKLLYSHDVTAIQTTSFNSSFSNNNNNNNFKTEINKQNKINNNNNNNNKNKLNVLNIKKIKNTNFYNPTINCIDCNDKNLLFIGLSSGALLSFNVDDNGLSNKKLIFQCTNNEGINCISRPILTNHNINKNNKIYIGCDDGSVIQYDFYSADIDVLIDKSNINKIYNDDNNNKDTINNNNNNDDYNNCGSCICISSCDDFVVAGYSSGHIKIVQKSELSFVIKQIAMHRRMVTSVSILQDMSLIATVSEDGFYHVLRNTTSSLDVIRSGSFENALLIGVKFVKSPHYSLYDQKYKDRMLIITGYDRNRVVFV